MGNPLKISFYIYNSLGSKRGKGLTDGLTDKQRAVKKLVSSDSKILQLKYDPLGGEGLKDSKNIQFKIERL